MQFTKLVAIIAISTMAVQAVAQDAQPTQGVVIMNTNTNENSASNAQSLRAGQTQTASQQPTTIVEANPVSESRAEAMRRARQNAEQNTEAKIVEKLEESRLREENERAERLFGNKLEAPAAAATATAVATPNGAAATATAVSTVEPVNEEKATTVTIEKVEIIQPTPVIEEAPVAPVAESTLKLDTPKEVEAKDRFYVSGILASPSYSASNVKSNYGLGVGLGVITKQNIGVEGTFLYSNHSVDTFWTPGIYKNLDQYDFTASAKYYIFPGPLKPYVGGSLSYLYRKYSDRVVGSSSWIANSYTMEEDTHAVNMGLLAGVDFELNENIMIGGGFDWNFNVMSKSEFNSNAYNVPNSKPLEEIDYYTLKLNAKVSF